MFRIITVFILFFCSVLVNANEKVITFAVGHDHEQMLSSYYPVYKANWEFINQGLGLLGYRVVAKPLPWARAKHLTQTGKADGLFLAANLAGRDKWATLSKPLGYGVFGAFYHVDRPDQQTFIASIRIGQYDKILSSYPPEDMLMVATAHQGFKLLINKRIDRFIMSESYGRYLLDTELVKYNKKLRFDTNLIEKRTIHIAFSKNHPSSLQALSIVNEAIALGIEKGLYKQAVERNKVPKRMRLMH